MNTLETRKPLNLLEGGEVWVRNEQGRAIGTFVPKNSNEPWRNNTFRPRINEQIDACAIAALLDAEIGLPIWMGK